MSKIALDNLQAGMKLSKAVQNSSGMVLLGENTELTVELIDKIGGMGVDSVYIQGLSKPSMPIEAMMAQLDGKFANIEKEPYMDTLKRVLQDHIAGLYE